MINSGVFKISKNKEIYNIFYNRIIFPIKNINGFIIGFGGRSLNNKKPKYINSYETFFFKKKKCFYGLWENKEFIKKLNYVILVEGYFDVLTLYKNKFKNVLSLMGVSISHSQINLIINLTKNIFICFDRDKAGFSALKKSIIFFINNYSILKINYIILYKNYDPDSFINNYGRIKFLKKIKNSINIYKLIFIIYIKNIFKFKKRIKKRLLNFKIFYENINDEKNKEKILYILSNNLKINLKNFFYIINSFSKKGEFIENFNFYEKKIIIVFVIYPQIIFFFYKDVLDDFISKSKINFLFYEILNKFNENLNFLNFLIKIKDFNIFFIFMSLFKIFEKKKLKNIILLKYKYKKFIKKLSFKKKDFFKKNISHLCNLFYNYIF